MMMRRERGSGDEAAAAAAGSRQQAAGSRPQAAGSMLRKEECCRRHPMTGNLAAMDVRALLQDSDSSAGHPALLQLKTLNPY